MNLSDLKRTPHQHLIQKVADCSVLKLPHPLVKKLTALSYDLDLSFLLATNELLIKGKIDFELIVCDGINGQEFNYQDEINWDDSYFLNANLSDQKNFICESEFAILDLILDQVNLNLPINLTQEHGIISKTGSGWEFLSESEYQQAKAANNNPDPRWAKLDEFKKRI